MSKSSSFVEFHENSWLSFGACLVILLSIIFFLYRDTLYAMIEIWERSDTFTHCFLVLPISLWLIWKKKSELLNYSPSTNLFMLAPFIFFNISWFLGDITATNAVSQVSLVGMVVSSVPLLLGLPAAKVIAFPLAFLFFAVPLGEFLLPTLMEWTANFTIFALRLSGIPVYRDGLQFVIPSGNWSVVEACSGIRYLIASVTIGTLFAYLNYTTAKRRLIFIGVSIVVPVFANWVRAYMIVMLGHFSGNTIAVGVDHIIYGWIFFGIVVISMFTIGIRWAEFPSHGSNTVALIEDEGAKRNRPTQLWIGLALGVLFSLLPVLFSGKINSTQNFEPVVFNSLPKLDDGWIRIDAPGADWKPAFKKSVAEFSSAYEKNGKKVGLYIGYYRNQYSDRKLISSDNVLVRSEDAHWNAVYRGQSEVDLPEEKFRVKSSTLKRINGVADPAGQQMDIWYFYWVNGRFTDNDYIAKVYTGISKLFGQGDDAAVIVLHVLREPGIESSEVLGRFLRENYSKISELLLAVQSVGVATVNTIKKS